MPSNSTFACVFCRLALKSAGNCRECGAPLKNMGKHWRAPKKNNLKAWKRVASGEIWWEEIYVVKHLVRVQSRWRSGRTYLSLRSNPKGGSALDTPEDVQDIEPRRKRRY